MAEAIQAAEIMAVQAADDNGGTGGTGDTHGRMTEVAGPGGATGR